MESLKEFSSAAIELIATSRTRVICDPPNTMAHNMFVDRLLFESLKEKRGTPTIRIYTWSEPCITVGFGINMSNIPNQFSGIPSMKRPTGGGMVYHQQEGEITISQTGFRDRKVNVNELYKSIHEPLIWTLNKLGIDAELLTVCPPNNSQLSQRTAIAACFNDAPCLYDGLLDGRKILGGGLRLAHDSFLYQGTIKIKNLSPIDFAKTLIDCPILSPNHLPAINSGKVVESLQTQ